MLVCAVGLFLDMLSTFKFIYHFTPWFAKLNSTPFHTISPHHKAVIPEAH